LIEKKIIEINTSPDLLVLVHSYTKSFSQNIDIDVKNHLFVVLDIKDLKTNQFIWRAEANMPISDNYIERIIASREKSIKILIKRMLNHFPPSK
jgi:hypothetical protein